MGFTRDIPLIWEEIASQPLFDNPHIIINPDTNKPWVKTASRFSGILDRRVKYVWQLFKFYHRAYKLDLPSSTKGLTLGRHLIGCNLPRIKPLTKCNLPGIKPPTNAVVCTFTPMPGVGSSIPRQQKTWPSASRHGQVCQTLWLYLGER